MRRGAISSTAVLNSNGMVGGHCDTYKTMYHAHETTFLLQRRNEKQRQYSRFGKCSGLVSGGFAWVANQVGAFLSLESIEAATCSIRQSTTFDCPRRLLLGISNNCKHVSRKTSDSKGYVCAEPCLTVRCTDCPSTTSLVYAFSSLPVADFSTRILSHTLYWQVVLDFAAEGFLGLVSQIG